MKNLFYFLLLLAVSFSITSCTGGDDNDDKDTTTKFEELTGNLTTRTLSASKKYLLKGQVFINSGQTVTIEPGTIIFGDKRTKGTLIVNKGGKLNAEGTKDKPIVFTSVLEEGVRDRGDWGGIVMVGNANVNQNEPAVEGLTPAVIMGTTNSTANDGESSGILKYVRVEFAGIELTPNNETNSITMGGVGRGTIMEYCMVSFGGDDGFEWFGGTVNGKYFISLATWDDDFDVDYGYAGNVQFGLAVRYPSFADQSGSNGFESDNGPNDNDVEPYTTGTFSNITVLGPRVTNNGISGNYQHAIDLRRRTAISIANSFFAGFPRGLRFNQASVVNQYTSNRGVLVNNIMLANTAAYQFGSGVSEADVKGYWEASNTTVTTAPTNDIYSGYGIKPALFYGTTLADAYPSNPDFKLVAGGSLLSGAKFDNAKFNEPNRSSFFQKVNFIGAFDGSNDWTDGWAEFNPVNAKY